MRARQFILREYSREKTAGVFGNKLIAGLAKDRSWVLTNQLGKAREYLYQRAKVSGLLDPQDTNRTDIINSIMAALESADPTANKQYVQWLAKVYANEGVMMEDLVGKARDWLETYDLYKKKRLFTGEDAGLANIMNLKYNDLANISKREDLAAKIEQGQAKTLPKGDSETVFENSQVRIIHPKDQEAACYYGQGTRWCTAATGSSNYFDNYNRSGPMYILLPKQPKYEGEKYQLHFESGQFMDETDSQIDVVELIDMRFGSDVAEFFMRVEPQIKDWLVFTPDEMLEPLIGKIKTAVNDHVYDIVNEWESDDEYWWEHLRSEGHIYPEGHEDEGGIDWDAVADADLSYTDWNYEAADFISRIVGAVDLSPSEVRELAQESDEYDFLTILDLADIMANSVEKTTSRNQGDGGVAEWIKDHIYIKKRDEDWEVSLLYTDRDGKRKEYAIN
jgi:hypothetical protein